MKERGLRNLDALASDYHSGIVNTKHLEEYAENLDEAVQELRSRHSNEPIRAGVCGHSWVMRHSDLCPVCTIGQQRHQIQSQTKTTIALQQEIQAKNLIIADLRQQLANSTLTPDKDGKVKLYVGRKTVESVELVFVPPVQP